MIVYKFPGYPGPYGETAFYYLVPLSDGQVFEITGHKERFNATPISALSTDDGQKNHIVNVGSPTNYDQVIEGIIPTLTVKN